MLSFPNFITLSPVPLQSLCSWVSRCWNRPCPFCLSPFFHVVQTLSWNRTIWFPPSLNISFSAPPYWYIQIDSLRSVPLVCQTCLDMHSSKRRGLGSGWNLCYKKRHVPGNGFPIWSALPKRSGWVCMGYLSRTASHPLTRLLLWPTAEASSSTGSSCSFPGVWIW